MKRTGERLGTERECVCVSGWAGPGCVLRCALLGERETRRAVARDENGGIPSQMPTSWVSEGG